MDLVITTIFPPSAAMRAMSRGLQRRGGRMWVIGDRRGPDSYDLPSARFFSLAEQRRLSFRLARLLPEGVYARKNLGYLLAIQAGAGPLVETDDDNAPLQTFWPPRRVRLRARLAQNRGWWNAYRAFSPNRIWPRGFPLEEIERSFRGATNLGAAVGARECLIQQGLADANPDVDAIYRLTSTLPVRFRSGAPVVLAAGCWCPFNSQNTTFFPPAFPLLYLPVHCSFRMTDIWRSFVAQRCLWPMRARLAFTAATVRQDRNTHNLLRDFADELPGYLNNERLRETLEPLALRPGRAPATVARNLLACYEALVQHGLLPRAELPLVRAWIRDVLEAMRSRG